MTPQVDVLTVGSGGRNILLQQVGSHRIGMLAGGRARFAAAHPGSRRPLRPHQPDDAFASAADALVVQTCMNAPTAVDPAADQKRLPNLPT